MPSQKVFGNACPPARCVNVGTSLCHSVSGPVNDLSQACQDILAVGRGFSRIPDDVALEGHAKTRHRSCLLVRRDSREGV